MASTLYHITGSALTKGPPENAPRAVRVNRRNGHFLYIDTKLIDFMSGPFLEGLVLWPGGEWHGRRPIWEEAAKNDRGTLVKKRQLWQFYNNDELAVIDNAGGVRIYTLIGGHFQLTEPHPHALAKYIYKRGLAAQRFNGVDWAIRQLERLHSACHSYVDRNWLAELSRKRADIA